jgi:siroheme decarboxylase
MDIMDRKLLDMLQDEFPLAAMPFVEIGKKLGITGPEVMTRLERLKNAGYIRRIGPVLDAKKLGYTSLLCAAAAGPDIIEDLAHAINAEPSVTHNYEREAELNLWFTITMRTQDDIDRFLKNIEDRFALTIIRFPEKRTFKINTRFATGDEDR